MAQPSLDDSQRQLAGTQADIAQLMQQIMTMRSRLTTPYEDEQGQLSGPMVDAVMQSLGNVQQAQATPRLRLQARPFNPFGEQRDMQTFGPSSPPTMSPAPPPPQQG